MNIYTGREPNFKRSKRYIKNEDLRYLRES